MANPNSGSVLVVDDEPVVAEAYALRLAEDYDVRIANDGREAIEKIDEDVDVVLLDRRMPDMSGGQTLERIREQGYDCRVAMVTAVDPDFDIVEMDFDDYLTKPITREEVERTVENLMALTTYDETVSEEFSLAKKQTALERHKDERQLRNDEQFQELRQRREEIQEEIDDSLEGIGTKRLRTMLESLREEEE